MQATIFRYGSPNRADERTSKTELTLNAQFNVVPANQAEIGLVIGGDGFMTKTVKEFARLNIPFYGINRGTYGFLMNDHPDADDFNAAVATAEWIEFPLLEAEVKTADGQTATVLAFNDVFTKTTTAQGAKHRVRINGQNIFGVDERQKEIVFIGDGLLVCTPGGSTAYNRAAHGIIIDHRSTSLGLTPIASFLPVGFLPQLIPGEAEVEIELLEDEKRKHLVIADNIEFNRVSSVKIRKARQSVRLGFKRDNSYFRKTLELRFPWLKGQTNMLKM